MPVVQPTTSRIVALMMVSTLLVVGIASVNPPASVQAGLAVVFQDDFSNGLNDWETIGSTIGTDCANGYGGGCALLVHPTQHAQYAQARQNVAIPMNGPTTFTVRFYNPDLNGHSDSHVGIFFAEGGGIDVTITGAANNLVQVNAGGWKTMYAMPNVAWRQLEFSIDPDQDTAVARVLTADGSSQLGSAINVPIPQDAATISLVRALGVPWTTAFNGRFLFDDFSITTGGSPEAPQGLQAVYDPADAEVHLTWSPPANDPDEVIGYQIWRNVNGGAFVPIGMVSPPTTSFTDVSLPCALSLGYAVTASNSFGAGPQSNIVAVIPAAANDLLCILNARHDMYWAPVDLDGDPTAVWPKPDTVPQLEAHLAATGQYPTWFSLPPASLTCCSAMQFDANLLEPGLNGGFIVPVQAMLAPLYPLAALEDVVSTAFATLGSGELRYDGFRFEGIPFVDPSLGAAAVDAQNAVFLQLRNPTFNASAHGSAAGQLVHDDTTGGTSLTGMDSLFVVAEFPGPGLPKKEGQLAIPFDFDLFGKSYAFSTPPLGYEMNLGTNVDAMLGGQVETGTFLPEVVAGGIGWSFEGTAGATMPNIDLNVLRLEQAGITFKAFGATKVEILAPFGNGLEPGEAIVSPYTQTRYTDIETPIATIVSEPAGFAIDPFSADVVVRGWNLKGERVNYWEGKVQPLPSGGLATPAAIIVLGQVHATSATHHVLPVAGATTSDARQIAANGPPPDERVELVTSVIEASGIAGATGDVTIARPMAYVAPDGTFEVAPWSFTLPAVTIGADGTAHLVVDLQAIQDDLLERTRDGATFEQATAEVNDQLDTDGDGIADRETATITPDERALSMITFAGSPPAELYVAEHQTIDVSVRDVWSDTPAPAGGTISVSLGDNVVATANWAGGASQAIPIALAASTTPGSEELTVAFDGTDAYRAARRVASVGVVDRAPVLDLVRPTQGQVIGGEHGFVVQVLGHINFATDIDLEASYAMLPGAPNATFQIPGGQFLFTNVDLREETAPTLADGFQDLQLVLRDQAGHTSTHTVTLAVDRYDPTMTVAETPTTLASGEPLVIDWSASEPLGVRATITSADGSEPMVLHSEAFDIQGAFTVEGLSPGAYTIAIEGVDAGGSHVVDGEATLVEGVVTLPTRALVVV